MEEDHFISHMTARTPLFPALHSQFVTNMRHSEAYGGPLHHISVLQIRLCSQMYV